MSYTDAANGLTGTGLTGTSGIRPASVLMDPRRAGSAWANALSFSRSFLRKLVRERWRVERVRFELDADGRGEALYRLSGGGQDFHFFVISNVFEQGEKVDRSFGVNWDASAAICQGPWTREREDVLRQEIPKQYSGRYDHDTLCFTRGNRSERIFDYVVSSLAAGEQPDPSVLAPVGYILRTTAFAGNGLFGTRPFEALGPDHPLGQSYHVQMAVAFLLREFVFDLVDHLAESSSAGAVRLDHRIKRYLGIGNSAGLGLIPFLANHPQIIHHWSLANEQACAEAASRPVSREGEEFATFRTLLEKARQYFDEDPRDGNGIFASYATLSSDLRTLEARLAEWDTSRSGTPDVALWRDLLTSTCRDLDAETRELTYNILLECFPDVIGKYEFAFNVVEQYGIVPEMEVGALAEIIDDNYRWIDLNGLDAETEASHFWYYPVEAPDEPRRAMRKPPCAYVFESKMDVPLQVSLLHRALKHEPADQATGVFLAKHPEFRAIVSRLQSTKDLSYAEFRQNFLDRRFTPFAAARFVLSFYGMEKFDPRPPRSVKGALLQGAPLAEDIVQGIDGDWPFPLIPRISVRTEKSSAREFPAQPSRVYEAQEGATSHLGSNAAPPGLYVRSQARSQETLFPLELRKLLTRALVCRGLDLGTAEAVAAMVGFSEMLGQGGLQDLVDGLPQCERIDLASMDVVGAASPAIIQASDMPAFVVAPVALDFACGLACRSASGGVVTTFARPVPMDLSYPAVLAAERGYDGAVIWHEKLDDGSSAERLSAAGRRKDGIFLLDAQFRSPVIAHAVAEQLSSDDQAVDLSKLMQCQTGQESPAFVTICRATGTHCLEGLVHRLSEKATGRNSGCEWVRTYRPVDLRNARDRMLREGFHVSSDMLDRLYGLAKGALVPEDAERLMQAATQRS